MAFLDVGVEVGAARIALRDTGPGIVSGSDRKLTFGGAESATIAAGALLISDPVALDLPPLGDVAVSVYLPEDLPPSFGITVRSQDFSTRHVGVEAATGRSAAPVSSWPSDASRLRREVRCANERVERSHN